MQTSGLKESCRYTSEGKKKGQKITQNNTISQETPSLYPLTTLNSLHTSPSFYLVFFQLIDLYLEAGATELETWCPCLLNPLCFAWKTGNEKEGLWEGKWLWSLDEGSLPRLIYSSGAGYWWNQWWSAYLEANTRAVSTAQNVSLCPAQHTNNTVFQTHLLTHKTLLLTIPQRGSSYTISHQGKESFLHL